MGSDPLRELDEPAASLRILVEANKYGQGINVTSLYIKMGELGIGRTAVDSSRKALVRAGLLVEEKMRWEGRGLATVLNLTKKGRRVVESLIRVQEILREKS